MIETGRVVSRRLRSSLFFFQILHSGELRSLAQICFWAFLELECVFPCNKMQWYSNTVCGFGVSFEVLWILDYLASY